MGKLIKIENAKKPKPYLVYVLVFLLLIISLLYYINNNEEEETPTPHGIVKSEN